MSFRSGRQCIFQFQLARSQTAVPLTRDYLHTPSQVLRQPERPRPVAVAK
jgi:hypothetical protein